MVEYYIEAIDQQGRHQTLTLSAKNSTMADELARSQGLMPTLITHAKAHERDQRHAVETRRRRRRFSAVGVVLTVAILGGGGAMWLHIQDLRSRHGFTLDAVRMAAQDPSALQNAQGADGDLEAFARSTYGAMQVKFPGWVRSVNVKSENLMFVYVGRAAREEMPEALEPVTRMLVQGFQRAYESDRCTVFMIEDGMTVADGRYADGDTRVSLHIDQ